jgi:hypothetical protein
MSEMAAGQGMGYTEHHRRGCLLRRSPRGEPTRIRKRLPLETPEQVELAERRELFLAARSKRKRREARARLEIVERSVLLGTTVLSSFVLWTLMITHPESLPLAASGFGAGGALAIGLGHWRARRRKESGSNAP